MAGWPRRLLAGALLLLGAVSALAAATPPQAADVIIARHALTAGTVLAAADVQLVSRRLAEQPDQALSSLADVAGQRTAGAVARGEVLTRPRLAVAAFTAALRSGHTAVSVAVTTSAASLLRPGSAVDVVTVSPAADPSARPAPLLLVADARVLAVWPGGDPLRHRDVVLDVPSAQAPAIALTDPESTVTVVIRSP